MNTKMQIPDIPNHEFDKYFKKIAKEELIKEHRFMRFYNWLTKNSFDSLIKRMVAEHSDTYIDQCYNKGYQPYPNNKLSFIFDYIETRGTRVDIKDLDCDFSNTTIEFMGYYFQTIYGQGAIHRIYKKDYINKCILNI